MADWHWRNSMKPVRFGPFDAKAAIPVAFCLLHLRFWTLGLAAVVMVLFWLLERRGLSFEAALRALRVWLVGPNRPALLWFRRTRFRDFG